MVFQTELNICQKIFGEKISIENENVRIETPYGIVHLQLSDQYPDESPQIDVTNNSSRDEILLYLREKAYKLRGDPIVYPLIVHFYNFNERFREKNKNKSQFLIFEASYDIIDESDVKMSENDFHKWMKRNIEGDLQKNGISGREYFVDLKKDDSTNKF